MEGFSINPISDKYSQVGSPEMAPSGASKPSQEFATMFYKEILSQCFKEGLLGDEEGPYSQMTKDILVEQLAKEFAGKEGININGKP